MDEWCWRYDEEGKASAGLLPRWPKVRSSAEGRDLMGSCVIKMTPTEDYYVLWFEGPACWGTREEVLAYCLKISERKEEFALPIEEARFERADKRGTSGLSGKWDDPGLIFENRGWLKRENLRAILDSFEESTDRFDLSLLEPFDDEPVLGYEDEDDQDEASITPEGEKTGEEVST